MTLAPIKGMGAKLFTKTLVVSMGLGLIGGAIYWFTVQVPHQRRIDQYYAKYDAKK
jgi:plastocyanin domain-containing protein